MRGISWLNLIGGIGALLLAALFVGGMAVLVGSIPMYIVIGIGLVLMACDIVVTNRGIAEKRDLR
ncbi:MAG: hypothetical protein KIT16_23330 [Rhodospirillaceae bacterium]|nr:hypothetical protein [Rhodospirillaceae bacterium]